MLTAEVSAPSRGLKTYRSGFLERRHSRIQSRDRKAGQVRDYSKATGQLRLKSQRRGSEMSQNAGSEEAERHGTRFSALFLGILSTQSRIGPGCFATVSIIVANPG